MKFSVEDSVAVVRCHACGQRCETFFLSRARPRLAYQHHCTQTGESWDHGAPVPFGAVPCNAFLDEVPVETLLAETVGSLLDFELELEALL